MKTTLSVLAMSVACALGMSGCATDGSPNMFTADFWNRDVNAVAINDQDIRHDKRPITQYDNRMDTHNRVVYDRTYDSLDRATGVDVSGADYSVTGPRRAPGQPNDATSGRVMNDTQLQHGNDKTRISAALNSQDQQFVLEAGSSGLYEVQAGQKALTKSSDGRVRTIAQHMIDDHTKANNALMALAQRKGVPAASIVPSAQHLSMLQRLDTLSGTDFDREYFTQQRDAHTQAIAKFQAQANNGFDRDLRDFAAATLPTLRGHLDMVNNNNSQNLGADR
jgi:putative membrane protein